MSTRKTQPKGQQSAQSHTAGVLQPKATVPQATRPMQPAPPVYHPHPLPKALQKKTAAAPPPNTGPGKSASPSHPEHRPHPVPNAVQRKPVDEQKKQHALQTTPRRVAAHVQSGLVQPMLRVRSIATAAAGVRRYSSSSGGGGKDPNRPTHNPIKGHYVDYFGILQKRSVNQRLYRLPNGKFIFMHQVNKGGESEIMNEGGLKGSEGRFGGSYARAKTAEESDARPGGVPVIFFTTSDHPISDHEGMLTGIQWEDLVRFMDAFCIHPDGSVTTYGAAFKDDKGKD